MYAVYKRLIEKGKHIIAVSNMYIPKEYMRQILNSCGYNKVIDIFVSCDYGLSKNTGALQELIQKQVGNEKRVIHIDDNKECLNGCKKTNWRTVYYKRCSSIGHPFRTTGTRTPVSQMYKGIVNNYLHCGQNVLNPQEEFGFIYAGISVCGYDEWLSELCKKNKYDKILFLARDMDVFYKSFIQYYNDVPCEYIQSSRNALRQFYFERCPGDFFEYVIGLRVGLGKTIEEVLCESDLAFLIPHAERENMSLGEFLTKQNEKELRDFIQKYREQFNIDVEVVKKYLLSKIGTAKRICIAGLGWMGSEIGILKWLIEEKWKMPVEVFGTLFGSNNTTKTMENILNSNISTFAFGETINRDLSFNCVKNKYVSMLALEHVFSSPECSLVKFGKTQNGEISFITEKNNPNRQLILDIHNGITLFIKEFMCHRNNYKDYLPISGIDAYEPLFCILSNKKYISLTLGDFVEKPRAISGIENNNKYIKLRNLL